MLNKPPSGHTWVDDLALPAEFSEEAALVGLPVFQSLSHYLEERMETGGMLRAVLENDLCGAATRMAGVNIYEAGALLISVVRLLQAYAPANAWGSEAAVAEWLATPLEDPDAGG